MGNTVIDAKLNDFWVNHNQSNLLRRILKQDTHNQGVDTDGFTGTGLTGNQQMRHLCEIGNDTAAPDILTNGKGNLCLAVPELGGLEKGSQINHGILAVWNLDTDSGLSGNRRLDTYVGSGKV